MSRLFPSFLLTLGLVAGACGGDDDDDSVDAAPSAVCERGVLETDNEAQAPLAGPAVDPETGELQPPPAAGYHVSTTYLQFKEGDATQQRFGELVGPIVAQLGSQPGLLAVQLSGSSSCGTARTLTVWESEEAMFEFVLGDAHQAAVGAVDEISRGGSAVTSWTATSVDQATWEAAAAHLADVEGPLY